MNWVDSVGVIHRGRGRWVLKNGCMLLASIVGLFCLPGAVCLLYVGYLEQGWSVLSVCMLLFVVVGLTFGHESDRPSWNGRPPCGQAWL
ncbi:hypothetical protein F5144DRAFT_183557 [Chaetomium tenue]|uniref:Uncharacterized protein n=1 Tax=Chaetomium tenue TaxID=1854479 RepID=A0ACB7PEX0_9PEZI|nr:hypothetical protein F5144DRAFT_183557 [Chaetomium globosum]